MTRFFTCFSFAAAGCLAFAANADAVTHPPLTVSAPATPTTSTTVVRASEPLASAKGVPAQSPNKASAQAQAKASSKSAVHPALDPVPVVDLQPDNNVGAVDTSGDNGSGDTSGGGSTTTTSTTPAISTLDIIKMNKAAVTTTTAAPTTTTTAKPAPKPAGGTTGNGFPATSGPGIGSSASAPPTPSPTPTTAAPSGTADASSGDSTDTGTSDASGSTDPATQSLAMTGAPSKFLMALALLFFAIGIALLSMKSAVLLDAAPEPRRY